MTGVNEVLLSLFLLLRIAAMLLAVATGDGTNTTVRCSDRNKVVVGSLKQIFLFKELEMVSSVWYLRSTYFADGFFVGGFPDFDVT
jgi:hypothetical protein